MQNNMVNISNPRTGEILQTLTYTDTDGIRTYKDTATGEVVKTLTICNGGVTEEQVKVWKAEHRKLHKVEVEDDGDLFVGYFRRPDMETMCAVNKLAKQDEVKSSSVMLENCWLGGDPVMKTDMVVRMAAIGRLSEIFNRVHGELKNL